MYVILFFFASNFPRPTYFKIVHVELTLNDWNQLPCLSPPSYWGRRLHTREYLGAASLCCLAWVKCFWAAVHKSFTWKLLELWAEPSALHFHLPPPAPDPSQQNRWNWFKFSAPIDFKRSVFFFVFFIGLPTFLIQLSLPRVCCSHSKTARVLLRRWDCIFLF